MNIDKEAIRAGLRSALRTGDKVLGNALVDKLLDALDERDRQRDEALALHYSMSVRVGPEARRDLCHECERAYPCPTARALGVEE